MTAHLIGIAMGASTEIVPLFAAENAVIDALTHHRSVVAALREGPFLPAAFGSKLGQNSKELSALLNAHRDDLQAALRQSHLMIEMGITLRQAEANVPEVSQKRTGRGFLRAAALREKTANQASAQIDNIVQAIKNIDGVRDCRILTNTTSKTSLAIAAMRASAPMIAEAIEQLSSLGPIIEVSGPWPLYSFGLTDILNERAAA